jgi:GTP-binding protein HflX
LSEKAVLVSISMGGIAETEASMEELALLADTAGAEPVAAVIQYRQRFDPATLAGKGKVAEIRSEVAAIGATLVIFDNQLSPAQERNLAQALGARVLDRTALILDIFAQHAVTREGRIQVELAQQRYRLPRLRGRGVELSRLGGGIGTRGPGETILEVDQRRIRQRISILRKDLENLARTRRVKRARRGRRDIPLVALVGYTNAGKSAMLNALTGANALVEDRLFATLDPTTRRLDFPQGGALLLSDTVGFVRNLPHQLVEAFKSTLEEAAEADLLLHVVDVAAPDPEGRIRVVRQVLEEIGAAALPELMVGNKADAASPVEITRFRATHPDAEVVSALTGEGLPSLVERLMEEALQRVVEVEVTVPFAEGSLAGALHEVAEVLAEEFTTAGTRLRVRLPVRELHRVNHLLGPDDPTLSWAAASAHSAQHCHHSAQQLDTTGEGHRRVGGVLRDEMNLPVRAAQPLDGGLLTADEGGHYLSVGGIGLATNDHQVAVEDTCPDH